VAKAKKAVSNKAGQIFIGVGGWTFHPWRSTFYPEKLPHHRELEYASSKLTSIEINGTYSRSLEGLNMRRQVTCSTERSLFIGLISLPHTELSRRVLLDSWELGSKMVADRFGYIPSSKP